MLRSERHVALNTAETAASSGLAAATMVLITSDGKSVNLARELLVTTMMLELIDALTSAGPLVSPRVHPAGPDSVPECCCFQVIVVHWRAHAARMLMLNELDNWYTCMQAGNCCALPTVAAWWVPVQGSCFHEFCFQWVEVNNNTGATSRVGPVPLVGLVGLDLQSTNTT